MILSIFKDMHSFMSIDAQHKYTKVVIDTRKVPKRKSKNDIELDTRIQKEIMGCDIHLHIEYRINGKWEPMYTVNGVRYYTKDYISLRTWCMQVGFYVEE